MDEWIGPGLSDRIHPAAGPRIFSGILQPFVEERTLSPTLVVLSGPLAGRSFPLGAEELSIGRHAGNALQLPDLAASRQHCRVEPEEGGFLVRDLERVAAAAG